MTPTTPVSDCPRCQRSREFYWYLGLYDFDVDKARQFVGDGREPVEVEEDSVRVAVDRTHMDEAHVAHVNPVYPGIIAHVRYRTEEGELIKGTVLIDGHHRAARCLQLQRPFFAYLLTEEESLSILVKSPEMPPEPSPKSEEAPQQPCLAASS